MFVTYCCFCQSQARFMTPDKYQFLLLRSSLNSSFVMRGLSLEDNIAFIFLNSSIDDCLLSTSQIQEGRVTIALSICFSDSNHKRVAANLLLNLVFFQLLASSTYFNHFIKGLTVSRPRYPARPLLLLSNLTRMR